MRLFLLVCQSSSFSLPLIRDGGYWVLVLLQEGPIGLKISTLVLATAPAKSLPPVSHHIIETSGSCLNLASLDVHGGLVRYCRTSCPNDRCCSLRNPAVHYCTLPHLLVNKVLPTSLEGALVTIQGSPCFISRSCGRHMGLGLDLSFSLLYSSI